MSSIISDIVLPRVNPAFARNDPVQWSDNLQLTLNSYNELLIVEPRFPSYHHAIRKTRNQVVLSSKEIFSVGQILHAESTNNLPLGRFVKVVFKNGDEFYNGMVNDPTIVLHLWTPILKTTRDCWLGVLFNTGEMLLLKRQNYKKLYSYSVKINLFEKLVEIYNIPIYEDKWYVSAEEYRHLKIKYFTFNIIEDVLYLVVVDSSNRISVFQFDDKADGNHCNGDHCNGDLHLVKQYDFNKEILRVKWSHNIFMVIGVDNSITVFDDNLEEAMELSPSQKLQNQKNEIFIYQDNSYIVSVFTSKVMVFEGKNKFEFNTHSWCACSSLVVGASPPSSSSGKLSILVGFEDGKFLTLDFDLKDKTFLTKENDQALDIFVERALYSFELANTENDHEVEGSIIVYGVHHLTDSILGIVYKVLPKNAIHYRIPSKTTANLSFVKLNEPLQTSRDKRMHTTSVTKLIMAYLEDSLAFPAILDDLSFAYSARLDAFLEEFELVVDKVLKREKICQYDERSQMSLQQSLKLYFLENREIERLQYKHTLARLFLSALQKYTTSNNAGVQKLYKKLVERQYEFQQDIRRYLSQVVLKTIASSDFDLNDYDNFVLMNMASSVNDFSNCENLFREKVSITVRGKSLVETFEIDLQSQQHQQEEREKEDQQEQQLLKKRKRMIVSTSQHGWATCDLTNLPILTMDNRVDELNQFRYICDSQANVQVMKDLLNTLGFCYISGNRIYNIR